MAKKSTGKTSRKASQTSSGPSTRKTRAELAEELNSLQDRLRKLERSYKRLKHSHQKLKYDEERYRALFTGSQAPMLLVDPDTYDIVDANNAACTFYGYDHSVLVGMNMSSINTLSDEGILQEMARARRKKRNYLFFRHRLANNRIKDVEVYANPVTISGKTYMYAVIHEITARRRAERALEKSRAELESKVAERTLELLDTNTALEAEIEERKCIEAELRDSQRRLEEAQHVAHLGSWEYHIPTGKARWSDEIFRIFGIKQERFPLDFKGFVDFVHPADRELFERSFKSALAGKGINDIEYRIIRPDDHIRHIHSRAEVVYDEKAAPLLLRGTIQDITERKEAEAELENFFKLSGDMLCIASMTHLLKINPAFEKVLGYKEEELLDIPFMDLIHPDDIAPTQKALEEKLKRGEIVISFVNRYRHKNGEYRWLEWTTRPVVEENILLGVARDITQRREMEDALKQALADKDLLIREIYHRTKNNLVVVQSLLKLQSRRIKDREARTMFNESRDRLKALSMVHERLYKSGDYKTVNFPGYVRSLVSGLSGSHNNLRSNVKLTLDIRKESMDVNTVIPCGLIINELVTNCLKHAFSGEEKGEIAVSCHTLDDTCTLDVHDNGVGLPEGFDVKKAASFGLELVDSLAKQIGGTFEIYSDEEGTTARLKFRDKREE